MNDKANLINRALEVAEEYPVFPCGDNKAPIVAGGFKAATQDPDEVERMFSLPAAALIGVPTGNASGLAVIDVDIRDGKAGKEWVEKNAEMLGNTRKVQTMSGGWHFYYKHEDGLRNSAGIDGNTDIRAEGGYVCYPDGEQYRFLNDEEIAPFPPEMRLKLSFYDGEMSTSFAQQVVEDGLNRIIDGREKYMASLIMATVAEYNRTHGVPPTVDYVVENAWPTYKARVGSRTGDLEREGRGLTEFIKKCESTIRRVRAKAIDDVEKRPEPKQGKPDIITNVITPMREIRLKFMEELEMAPPPKFLVGDYIVENSFVCLYAPPASFKSFLVMDWALSVAHGADWAGRPTRKAPVVYLAMEGQTGLINRALAWHNDRKLEAKGVQFAAVTTSLMMADNGQADTQALIEAIKNGMKDKPAMIIIDTLSRVMDGDENTQTSMSAFVRHCQQIQEAFECAVVVVHHTGKAGNGARGSSVLQGAVDTELEIKREAGGQGVVKLLVTKQKDIEEAEPMHLKAREVSYVSHGLAPERTSLVLDVIDAPDGSDKGSGRKRSKLQNTAIEVLERLLTDPNIVEHDADGSRGVPVDMWQRAVDDETGERKSAQAWHGRRSDWHWLSEFNGLVNFSEQI